jgi:hypothetical protein
MSRRSRSGKKLILSQLVAFSKSPQITPILLQRTQKDKTISRRSMRNPSSLSGGASRARRASKDRMPGNRADAACWNP